MAPQFIYVMKGLRKVVPPSRIILDDIWLSFYPDAKIGVLGANGAGKSSLLRIMAGVDQEFQGEAWAAKGTRIGYLAQEPQLDPTKDVRGNVEEAVRAQRALLDEFNNISMQFAEPMDDEAMTKLLDRQAKVQEQIDAHDLWNLDNKIEVAMDALRLPPGDAEVTNLSGGEKRRVALCRVLLEEPDMLLLDEPTNHLDAESVVTSASAGGSRSASMAISILLSRFQRSCASICSCTFACSSRSFCIASSSIGSANFAEMSLNRSRILRCGATASSTLPRTSSLGSSSGSCAR